jgi:predicted CopG family antitoxin
MPNLTISIPEELRKELSEFKVMNWSEVAREAFEKKIVQLKILESFSKDSELTQEDALRLGKKVNEALSKRFSKRCK